MTKEKIVPLTQREEYQSAKKKVGQLAVALTKTTDLLNQCNDKLAELRSVTAPKAGVMDRALALASGTAHEDKLVTNSLSEERERLSKEKKLLEDGFKEALTGADAVANRLAREAGFQHKERHIAAAKKVFECLQQLCQANDEEQQLRQELANLGYENHGLPTSSFVAIGGISDWWGSPAYYFAKEARQYIPSL